MQRPDGTFFAAVKLSLDETSSCPRTRRRRSRRHRCSALSTSNWPRRWIRRGWQAQDGSNIPLTDRRYPTTEEVLSALGVVVNKGNLGALQDITDETYAAVAGRAGSFADLIPRLAELASSLDQQTADIIAAAEGLNRFAGILARSKDSLGRALDSLPGALKVLNDNRPTSSTPSPRCGASPASRRTCCRDQGRLRRRLQGHLSGDQGAQRRCRRLHHGPGAAADVPVPLQVPAQRGPRRLSQRVRHVRPDAAAHSARRCSPRRWASTRT